MASYTHPPTHQYFLALQDHLDLGDWKEGFGHGHLLLLLLLLPLLLRMSVNFLSSLVHFGVRKFINGS